MLFENFPKSFNMVVIAIAGGANGLSRTIAETVLRQGKHQVKILSRSVSKNYLCGKRNLGVLRTSRRTLSLQPRLAVKSSLSITTTLRV
jgi:NAD(P)-dependent dehydrogenase (short-subunit alcohol dehydrogenase family)